VAEIDPDSAKLLEANIALFKVFKRNTFVAVAVLGDCIPRLLIDASKLRKMRLLLRKKYLLQRFYPGYLLKMWNFAISNCH